MVSDDSRREELDMFHTVLTDISLGRDSNDVRSFLIDAYIRGLKVGCAETAIVQTRRVHRSTLDLEAF